MSGEYLLQRLANRSIRRSFIRRTGKVVFGAVGIGLVARSLAEVTPKSALAQTYCSGTAELGMCGLPCDHCYDGTVTSCPSGDSTGSSYWAYYITGLRVWYYYYDCCTIYTPCANSTNQCKNNCPQDTWCSGNYDCTYVVTGGSC